MGKIKFSFYFKLVIASIPEITRIQALECVQILIVSEETAEPKVQLGSIFKPTSGV